MILLLYSCLLYSPVVVRWLNTLFLGIDACFKLKLKDRGFNDPDLGTGLAYMVKDRPYQKCLQENSYSTEPVSSLDRRCARLLTTVARSPHAVQISML